MPPKVLRRATRVMIMVNLVGQILIIGTGGAVRLTGSGLGCSTWPECEPGRMIPEFREAASYYPYVEFGNRMMGVVLGFIAVALVVVCVLAVRRLKRSPVIRNLAITILLLVLLQGLVGGLSVRLKLHPAIVGSHFLLSAILVFLSTLLWIRWRSDDSPRSFSGRPALRPLSWLLAVLAAIVVILGVIVTGAGPYSGDDQVGYRFAIDPLRASQWHALAVWAFLATLGSSLVLSYDRKPQFRAGKILLWVTLAQGGIGYLQVFTGLPELVVGVHLIGAALLIAAVTYFCSTLYAPSGQNATAGPTPESGTVRQSQTPS